MGAAKNNVYNHTSLFGGGGGATYKIREAIIIEQHTLYIRVKPSGCFQMALGPRSRLESSLYNVTE